MTEHKLLGEVTKLREERDRLRALVAQWRTQAACWPPFSTGREVRKALTQCADELDAILSGPAEAGR